MGKLVLNQYEFANMVSNSADNKIAKKYGNMILPCIKVSFVIFFKVIKSIIKKTPPPTRVTPSTGAPPNACAMIGLTIIFKKTMNIAINIEIKRTMYFI